VKKVMKRIGAMLALVLVLDLVFGILYVIMVINFGIGYQEDIDQLRSTVAGVYFHSCTDPDFVNSATDDHPMQVPDKYYKVKKSKLGHGRTYAVMYADGDIEAYFGTPEKNYDFYMSGKEIPNSPRFPFLICALQCVGRCPHVVLLVGIYAGVVAAIVACWYVRHRKKKASKETVNAIQTDSKPDEVS